MRDAGPSASATARQVWLEATNDRRGVLTGIGADMEVIAEVDRGDPIEPTPLEVRPDVPSHLLRALEGKVRGVLPKDAPAAEAANAIRPIAAEVNLSPATVRIARDAGWR